MLIYGLLSLAGLMLAAGQQPLGLIWLALPGLTLAIYLFPQARRPFRAGWLFGFAYFAGSMFWIVEPFFVEPERYAWMAPFGLIGLAGGLAIFWGLAFRFAARLGRARLTLAVMLAGAELMRGYVLTGFPWGMIGYLWLDWPAMQLAGVIGSYGLTLLTLAALAVLADAIADGRAGRIALGALPLIILALIGLLRDPATEEGPTPQVRLIQPNAPQKLKWDPEFAPGFFRRATDLSATPSDVPTDIVIWPETSVPFGFDTVVGDVLPYLAETIPGPEFLLGVQRFEGRNAYNSMIRSVDGQLRDIYDKQHLVPFGEYVPLLGLAERLNIASFAAVGTLGYTPGPGPVVIDLGEGGRVLPLICYEAVFPQDLRVDGPRPDWIVHVTNDAWFGDLAGPQQHLAQTRIRAIEFGLPVLRAANTGISAFIAPDGSVLSSIPLGQDGALDGQVPAKYAETLYSRTGDWPVTLVLLMLAGAIFVRKYRNLD